MVGVISFIRSRVSGGKGVEIELYTTFFPLYGGDTSAIYWLGIHPDSTNRKLCNNHGTCCSGISSCYCSQKDWTEV